MSLGTGIEWTDATWNPVRGCTRVSEGCRNCYAERVAARFSGRWQPYEGFARFVTAPGGPREARWTGRVALVPSSLALPRQWRRPRRIFVNSMSDLFHEALADDDIARVFAAMVAAPQHTYQVLTKRAARLRDWASVPAHHDVLRRSRAWIGVSVEDQATADERVPCLLDVPAAVRFLSCEPLLGPVTLGPHAGNLHWVIVGGESGPAARPMHPAWVRSIRDECAAASVPFFFKQWGAWAPGSTGEQLRIAEKDTRSMTVDSRMSSCPAACMIRAGKRGAGRLLDGRAHDAFPATPDP